MKMKNKEVLLVIAFILVCVVIFSIFNSDIVPHYGFERIQFSIFTEKTSYNVGEKIEVSIMITNPNGYVVEYPSITYLRVSGSLNGKPLRGGYDAYLTPGHTTSTILPHLSFPINDFALTTFTPTEKGDLIISYTIKGIEFTLSDEKSIQIK
jgi:hypothetical protein